MDLESGIALDATHAGRGGLRASVRAAGEAHGGGRGGPGGRGRRGGGYRPSVRARGD